MQIYNIMVEIVVQARYNLIFLDITVQLFVSFNNKVTYLDLLVNETSLINNF